MKNTRHSRSYSDRKIKKISVMYYRTYAALLFVLAITFLCGFFYTNAFAKEDALQTTYKYYTSLEVERGDTLWSIASEYADEAYCSVQEYIEELKYMNNLTSDKIVEGHYLTISYYSEECK